MTTDFRSAVRDFVFPPVCHICGVRTVAGERHICTRCLVELPRTLYHRTTPNAMEQRFAGLFPFVRATALCFYSRHSSISRLIQDFKYRKYPSLARHMGAVMATELLPTGFFSDADIILPVPMHRFKRWRRGYNQAMMLALGVSDILDLPLCTDLHAIRSHRTQTAMTAGQRRLNLQGSFRLRHPERLASRHILIVDDVCTTGATITACATTILDAQPTARVSVLTLGVTF